MKRLFFSADLFFKLDNSSTNWRIFIFIYSVSLLNIKLLGLDYLLLVHHHVLCPETFCVCVCV